MSTYPLPLSNRLDYANDGTVVACLRVPTGWRGFHSSDLHVLWAEVSASDKAKLNSESGTTFTPYYGFSTPSWGYLALLFPHAFNMSGYYLNASTSADSVVLYTSSDTTNGYDGSWTDWGVPSYTDSTSTTAYRSAVTSVSFNSITALRIGVGYSFNYFRSLNIYGSYVDPVDTVKLYRYPTNEEVTGANVDWRDVPLGSSGDVQYRVKNVSATRTVRDLTLSFAASYVDGSPSNVFNYFLSGNGDTFRSSLAISSLGPGQISDPFTVRIVVDESDSTSAPWTVKLDMDGTWT